MFKFIVASVVLALACADNIERDAQIVAYQSDILPDGHYQYAYETTNGIAAQEQGVGGVAASGSAKYVAPDGQTVQLTYTADENGFLAQGSHVPQIPEEILKSLEWNRAHPEEDDYLNPQLSAGGAPQPQRVVVQAVPSPAALPQQFITIRPNGYSTPRPFNYRRS